MQRVECQRPSTTTLTPFAYVTSLIRMCDMTHSYVWHDSFICVIRPIHVCDVTRAVCGVPRLSTRMLTVVDPFTYVTWLIRMCDMTHSYVWHNSFICIIRPIHVCDVTRAVCGVPKTIDNDVAFIDKSFGFDTAVSEAVKVCDMTRSNVWRDSFVRAIWLIHMCDMTHLDKTFGCQEVAVRL